MATSKLEALIGKAKEANSILAALDARSAALDKREADIDGGERSYARDLWEAEQRRQGRPLSSDDGRWRAAAAASRSITHPAHLADRGIAGSHADPHYPASQADPIFRAP